MMDAHIIHLCGQWLFRFCKGLGQVITLGNTFHVVIMHHEILLFILMKSTALQLHETSLIFALIKKRLLQFLYDTPYF